MFYDPKKIEVLLDEETLSKRIHELGAQITADYAENPDIILIAVLKGSYVFLADLARAIDLPLSIDFLGLSSYGSSTKSSGVVRMTQDLSKPIKDRDIVIVEDIVDTGLTMKYLLDNLQTRQPRSIKVASLLHKPARAQVEVPIDYVGFVIPDRFVIGYGLDFDQRLRNLPFIGVSVDGGPPYP
ncbi:hypoxanthine phosphoribosyltransferase [Myxococcota bacterium]|nr:hypoxanthine phosphoribosyltransferase [Myxococcota bacterium]MBU1433229.1 hypoxanthine phosphoribosyltransferase [Myxococcota bacterium]MBU1896205.1 hypoxanthine phosphoribosyltransferase [Myxococcota bacterium]